MPDSTLVVWLGEKGIQLFRVPKDLYHHEKADGCYLNFTNLEEGSEEGCDTAEHLAYLLGVEKFYGAENVPSLQDFLKTRADERTELKRLRDNMLPFPAKPHDADGDDTILTAHAPYSKHEIDTVGPGLSQVQFPPVIRIIRCGWLV